MFVVPSPASFLSFFAAFAMMPSRVPGRTRVSYQHAPFRRRSFPGGFESGALAPRVASIPELPDDAMPRFVILEHDWPSPHWDFLLEFGPVLRAWRLSADPAPGRAVPAEPNADHRPFYLD